MEPKNIIVCCDGTGNEYNDDHNTNVVLCFEALVRDENQIGFYDPGVGTFDALGRVVGKKVGVVLGQAFGTGLDQNIEDAYRYLMNRHNPGDRVFLFGFSRGAFTARAIAGMLFKVGLLQKGSENLIPYATKIYNGRKPIGPKDSEKVKKKKQDHNDHNRRIAEGFKRTYCHECRPYFIGVWDTVGALGHFLSKKFFDATLHEDVRYGYHAVSIDEKRKKFPVSLWNEEKVGPSKQTIEQVWFAGVHSDVGGWYMERGLSNAALRWMLQKAAGAGLRLKPGWDERLEPRSGVPPNPGMKCRDPDAQHESRKGLLWKMYRPVKREFPENPRIHQSVFDRMNDGSNTYVPWLDLPERYRVEPWGVGESGGRESVSQGPGARTQGAGDAASSSEDGGQGTGGFSADEER